MVAFYWGVIAFIFLIFDYVNYAYPNPLNYYPSDPYQSGISYEMASIIVLVPIYLLLAWAIRRDAAKDASRKNIWVRRWALILTLFVAGATIAVDLITLLTTFLNGEALTSAFLLKALVVFLVALGVFLHFISDLKGYWEKFPSRRKSVEFGATVLAVIVIIAGFFIVGTPAQARLARFDEQKVNDLQNIQGQVVNYWQAKQKLPTVLSDLNNSLSYGPLPVDPQTGQPYTYQATGALSFKLCADFNAQGRPNQQSRYAYPMPVGVIDSGIKSMMQPDNWTHAAGNVCFDRTIDPSFYPPLKQ